MYKFPYRQPPDTFGRPSLRFPSSSMWNIIALKSEKPAGPKPRDPPHVHTPIGPTPATLRIPPTRGGVLHYISFSWISVSKAGVRISPDQHYMGSTYLLFTLKLEWENKRTNETGNAKSTRYLFRSAFVRAQFYRFFGLFTELFGPLSINLLECLSGKLVSVREAFSSLCRVGAGRVFGRC